MKKLIPHLAAKLQHLHDKASLIPVPDYCNIVPQSAVDDITHEWLWPRVGQFFKDGDVILAETGMFEAIFFFSFVVITSI